MEVSSAASSLWFSEFVSESAMDEYDIIQQCHMDSLADLSTAQEVLRFQESLSSEINSTFCSYPADPISDTSPCHLDSDQNQRPSKLLKASGTSACWISSSNSNENSNSNSSLLQNNLWDEDASDPPAAAGGMNNNTPPMAAAAANDPCENADYNGGAAKSNAQGNKRASSANRSPSHAQDHIMAERRRREKLSERFIALSALVPGLKKMDKASVLGDAIKYMKQLQEQVRSMEEQSKKRTVESVVFVKKSQLSAGVDESSSCEDNSEGNSDGRLPEIEAKVSGNDVLIRVHCENQKGVVMKILAQIEKLHLCVVNSSVLPFGNFTLDMTIIAQKDANFDWTNVRDLVKELRQSLLKFM